MILCKQYLLHCHCIQPWLQLDACDTVWQNGNSVPLTNLFTHLALMRTTGDNQCMLQACTMSSNVLLAGADVSLYVQGSAAGAVLPAAADVS